MSEIYVTASGTSITGVYDDRAKAKAAIESAATVAPDIDHVVESWPINEPRHRHNVIVMEMA